MIYLDSAATSLQKPPAVAQAAAWAIRHCASPGRGGHPPAALAAQVVFRCRSLLADSFGVSAPDRVIFTSNATHSLNIAIRSLVTPGSRVVISGYEHNAVTRTLASIPHVTVSVAVREPFDPRGDFAAFEEALQEDTAAVICSHVSNVFGYILPIGEIAALCAQRGVPLILDASQSAGVLPVSLRDLSAAYVAFPGHKGLMGPQGTGVLLCGARSDPRPFVTGGTGSDSLIQEMPGPLPDRLEGGTHNLPGIAGLCAGLQFVRRLGTERILQHERKLRQFLWNGLCQIPTVQVISPEDPGRSTGVLSFQVSGRDCETVAAGLAERGIAVRAGLHCAPLAHRTAGTLDGGTVRISLSPFNRTEEIGMFLSALRLLLQK